MIRVMIVDDEQFAREELAALLEEIGGCEIVGSCANAIEGDQGCSTATDPTCSFSTSRCR